MKMNDFVVKASLEDIAHSSGYAKAQSGSNFGATSSKHLPTVCLLIGTMQKLGHTENQESLRCEQVMLGIFQNQHKLLLTILGLVRKVEISI